MPGFGLQQLISFAKTELCPLPVIDQEDEQTQTYTSDRQTYTGDSRCPLGCRSVQVVASSYGNTRWQISVCLRSCCTWVLQVQCCSQSESQTCPAGAYPQSRYSGIYLWSFKQDWTIQVDRRASHSQATTSAAQSSLKHGPHSWVRSTSPSYVTAATQNSNTTSATGGRYNIVQAQMSHCFPATVV